MSDDEFQRIEVITGGARRRRWSGEQKLRMVEESFQSGETISVVARRHGVAPNLLFRWRRLASKAGAAAVTDLSKRTMANIKQNITLALGLKAVFLLTTIDRWPRRSRKCRQSRLRTH